MDGKCSRDNKMDWVIKQFNDTDTIHSSSAKKNHKLVVPVCKYHHDKGDCSFHKGKKEMAKIFTKESLIIIANRYFDEFKNSSINKVNEDYELIFD